MELWAAKIHFRQYTLGQLLLQQLIVLRLSCSQFLHFCICNVQIIINSQYAPIQTKVSIDIKTTHSLPHY